MRRHCAVPDLLAAVLVFLAAACGGGRESGSPATPASTGTRAPTAPDRCPLTAEQVSAAVRETVKGPDSACMFYPDDDPTVRPNVTFVRQVTFACTGTFPADAGYTEQVSGLGVAAHLAERGDGLHLLVCQQPVPFELRVGAATPELRREAAIALAKTVLSGSN